MARCTTPSLLLVAIFTLACAAPKLAPPVDAPVLVPGADEMVAVDQVVLLIDASSSVPRDSLFQDEKSLARSFARSMPEGDYETSAIVFGGFQRERIAPAPFDRGRIVRETEDFPHLAEGTPIHKAIAEAGSQLEDKRGRAAVLLYSDGAITDEGGKHLDPQLAVDAAAQLAESYDGSVCFHTVQVGSEPDGAALLRRIAATTRCGSFRQRSDVTTVAALHGFERDVFFAGAPPPVAAAPRDTDRDGVIDADDLCPGTPRSASVDRRGCWVLTGLLFDTDSTTLHAEGKSELDEVVGVLRQNDDQRVRLDGHTDATGSDAYNLGLSKRRAEAVRSYLVSAGIDASRLEVKGHGEASPAADNATAEGRQTNRRTEITVVH